MNTFLLLFCIGIVEIKKKKKRKDEKQCLSATTTCKYHKSMKIPSTFGNFNREIHKNWSNFNSNHTNYTRSSEKREYILKEIDKNEMIIYSKMMSVWPFIAPFGSFYLVLIKFKNVADWCLYVMNLHQL